MSMSSNPVNCAEAQREHIRGDQMSTPLTLLLAVFILWSAAACGSSDQTGGASGSELADLSQFPTPSGSRSTPESTPQPTQAMESQPQGDEATPETPPLTQEELQQIRQRLQSGDLTQEEAQDLLQLLQGQLGGRPGEGAVREGGGRPNVGAIESIDAGGLTLTTEAGVITVNLSDDSDIRITVVLDPAELAEGTQVSAIVERAEGRNVARTITVIPDGQSGFGLFSGGTPGGFGGAGFPGGGQGGQNAGGVTPLFGTVASLAENGFTLETQQGPLAITTDEESIVVRTGPGTRADLRVGMQVRVTGPSDESGQIDAISVVVTPEGLEDSLGLGRGGLGGGGPLGNRP